MGSTICKIQPATELLQERLRRLSVEAVVEARVRGGRARHPRTLLLKRVLRDVEIQRDARPLADRADQLGTRNMVLTG